MYPPPPFQIFKYATEHLETVQDHYYGMPV